MVQQELCGQGVARPLRVSPLYLVLTQWCQSHMTCSFQTYFSEQVKWRLANLTREVSGMNLNTIGFPSRRREYVFLKGYNYRYHNKIMPLAWLSSSHCKTLLWDCRRNQTLPNVLAFKSNVQLKNEAELYIARTGNKMEFFKRKVGDFWIVVTTFSFSFLRKDW